MLFNRSFEKQGPPFGGDIATYQSLFGKAFYIHTLDICQNSITPRAGTEVVFSFIKNNHVNVALYDFEGITCNGCMVTVSEHFAKNEGVHQVSMSSDYANVLIVSDTLIDIRTLQSQIMYDAKYRIKSR